MSSVPVRPVLKRSVNVPDRTARSERGTSPAIQWTIPGRPWSGAVSIGRRVPGPRQRRPGAVSRWLGTSRHRGRRRAPPARLTGVTRPLVPIPLARGSRGAVVAPHHLATAAGLGILRAGGSAVDAAIATNAVLAVVDGDACGIGGDAFWLIWDAAERRRAGAQRLGPVGPARDAAALRRAGTRAAAAARRPGDHRPGRRPVVGRRPRSLRTAAAGGDPGAGDRARRRRLPGLGRVHRRGRGKRADLRAALGGDAAWFSIYRPHGRPWRPGERVRLPALARPSRRIADHGWDEFYERRDRRAPGPGAGGRRFARSTRRTSPRTRSTWTEPIAIDYRGVRVTSHPPNSSGFVALEILNVLEQFEPPPVATFAGGAGADLRWIHLGIEAAKLAMADRDAHLTDPASPRGAARAAARRRLRGRAGRRIDPGRASRPPAAAVPRGGGTIWLGVVDGEGNAVSLIESNYMGFGSGVVDPATGIAYQNRGSYFSLDPDHPNVLAPAKRTLHTLMPGMLFRDGRPWVVLGSMGGDAQPQIHAQVVSALVDGGVDVATAVGDAALVRRAGRSTSRHPTRSGPSRASGPGCSRGSRRSAIRSPGPRRSTAGSATATRSSSSTAGPPRAGAWRRRPIRGAPACRRSGSRPGEAPAPRPGRADAIRRASGTSPILGAAGGCCAHDHCHRHAHISGRESVSSNVGQNYPYTSETEDGAGAGGRAIVEAHPELAAKLAAESTPLDANERVVGLEVPDEGLRRAPPRRRLRGREARRVRRLRRDLREDLPALTARDAALAYPDRPTAATIRP